MPQAARQRPARPREGEFHAFVVNRSIARRAGNNPHVHARMVTATPRSIAATEWNQAPNALTIMPRWRMASTAWVMCRATYRPRGDCRYGSRLERDECGGHVGEQLERVDLVVEIFL